MKLDFVALLMMSASWQHGGSRCESLVLADQKRGLRGGTLIDLDDGVRGIKHIDHLDVGRKGGTRADFEEAGGPSNLKQYDGLMWDGSVLEKQKNIVGEESKNSLYDSGTDSKRDVLGREEHQVTSYCNCKTCTQEVWDAIATDDSGSYSCGARISWLQTVQAYSESLSCETVANQFPGLCHCDPTQCNESLEPTFEPTKHSSGLTGIPTTQLTQTLQPQPPSPFITDPTSEPTPFFADGLCENYCSGYFDTCSNWNIYLNPKLISAPISSDTAHDPELPRLENSKSVADAYAECLTTCMKWPRPIDPREYTGDEYFGSRLAGDTFWCRDTHLWLASFNPNVSSFHCTHSTNPSAGICREALIDGFTPYEWLRNGADTKHRIPYCDLASNDKVADCTMGGVTGANLDRVLRLLPGSVEMLFLNGNTIPELKEGTFTSLKNPQNLKALYLNTCGIEIMHKDALQGLSNLVIFAAYQNNVLTLHEDFLQHTPKLLDFSMAMNDPLFRDDGKKFPVGFFQHTKDIEVINMYQNSNLTVIEDGTFDNLKKLRVISFVDNKGITSFPAGLFDDLVALEHFHFFGNPITTFPANFFGPWAKKINSLALWNCPITSFSTEGLENLESIEGAYFYTEPGAPNGGVGGMFDNDLEDVFDILYGINPMLTFAYGTANAPIPIRSPAPEACDNDNNL